MAECNWRWVGEERARRPHLKPLIGSGLKTDTDILTPRQPGSRRTGVAAAAACWSCCCSSSPGQKNKQQAGEMFFPGFAPRSQSIRPRAKQGQGLLCLSHSLESKKKSDKKMNTEARLGFRCSEGSGWRAAWRCHLAKWRRNQLEVVNLLLENTNFSDHLKQHWVDPERRPAASGNTTAHLSKQIGTVSCDPSGC